MMNENFYSDLQLLVKQELSCSAHDLSHVGRVFHNACRLAAEEKADLDIIKTAALLHDIAKVKEDRDSSGTTDHAVLGADMAAKILRDRGCDEVFVAAVTSAIRSHRFRGDAVPATLEAKILFDADKLDALGAIGLARCFMIAGEYGQPLFSDEDQAAYIAANLVGATASGRIMDIRRHAPNLEFDIKMRKIPGRLFTPAAKKLADERLAFMQMFFDTLAAEVRTSGL